MRLIHINNEVVFMNLEELSCQQQVRNFWISIYIRYFRISTFILWKFVSNSFVEDIVEFQLWFGSFTYMKSLDLMWWMQSIFRENSRSFYAHLFLSVWLCSFAVSTSEVHWTDKQMEMHSRVVNGIHTRGS